MQFLKQLGKQVGFVSLVMLCMFSASSARAVTYEQLFANKDILMLDEDFIKSFFPPGVTKLKVLVIGGRIFEDPPIIAPFPIFDPFEDAGAAPSSFNVFVNGDTTTVAFISDQDDLLLDLDSGFQSFHYGFSINGGTQVPGQLVENPSFLDSFIVLQDEDSGDVGVFFIPDASPVLATTFTGNAPTQSLVIYNEAISPTMPGMGLASWTEVQVEPENTSILGFENVNLQFSSDSEVIVPNAAVLQSNEQIPLDQLNQANLPPTSEGFQPIPGNVIPPCGPNQEGCIPCNLDPFGEGCFPLSGFQSIPSPNTSGSGVKPGSGIVTYNVPPNQIPDFLKPVLSHQRHLHHSKRPPKVFEVFWGRTNLQK